MPHSGESKGPRSGSVARMPRPRLFSTIRCHCETRCPCWPHVPIPRLPAPHILCSTEVKQGQHLSCSAWDLMPCCWVPGGQPDMDPAVCGHSNPDTILSKNPVSNRLLPEGLTGPLPCLEQEHRDRPCLPPPRSPCAAARELPFQCLSVSGLGSD